MNQQADDLGQVKIDQDGRTYENFKFDSNGNLKPGPNGKELLRKNKYTKEKVKMAVNREVQFLFNQVKPQQRRYSQLVLAFAGQKNFQCENCLKYQSSYRALKSHIAGCKADESQEIKYCTPAFDDLGGWFCFLGSNVECGAGQMKNDTEFWNHMSTHSEEELALVGIRNQETLGLSSRANRIGQQPNNKRGAYQRKFEGFSSLSLGSNYNRVQIDSTGALYDKSMTEISSAGAEAKRTGGQADLNLQIDSVKRQNVGAKQNESNLIEEQKDPFEQQVHHLFGMNFDRIGRPVTSIKQYEYQFSKQIQEQPLTESFRNSLNASSKEFKHKAVKVLGPYSITPFKRSPDVNTNFVRDGYQLLFSLHCQNTTALNDSRVQTQKLGPKAVFIADTTDWYCHVLYFDAPVKTLPQLKYDMTFEDQKAVLFQLYDKMQTLHSQGLYHGNINIKTVLYARQNNLVKLQNWNASELFVSTGSNANCPIATKLTMDYQGKLRDVLGILWTLADINHIHENLTQSREIKTTKSKMRSPSKLARDQMPDSSEVSLWANNCSQGMGFWKDSKDKPWSFAQLMIEISRRLQSMGDFEAYLIAAAKFLKPEDAEIIKSVKPIEETQAGEKQVENEIKPKEDNNKGKKNGVMRTRQCR